MRYVTLTAFALLLVSSESAIGANTHPAQQYLVTVALQEIPAARSKEQRIILADPQVMVLSNEEASFNKSGQRTLRENKIPFGTLLKVNVTPISGKNVRVTGVLEVSSVGTLDDDVIPRESFAVHFDKTVVLGNKTRVCVSKSSDKERWFELLVDEPKNLRAGNVVAKPAAAIEPLAGNPASNNRSPTTAK